MNDKATTLGQIHLELEKYSITSRSWNVIMQGDVLGLVKCSSMERRKFIDEVAGVGDFNRKIEAATGELEIVENRVKDSLLVMSGLDENLEN